MLGSSNDAKTGKSLPSTRLQCLVSVMVMKMQLFKCIHHFHKIILCSKLLIIQLLSFLFYYYPYTYFMLQHISNSQHFGEVHSFDKMRWFVSCFKVCLSICDLLTLDSFITGFFFNLMHGRWEVTYLYEFLSENINNSCTGLMYYPIYHTRSDSIILG